jgi:hypothetical protein
MKKIKWNVLGEEKGSTIVILAVAMTALLGMAALVADVGVNYLRQARIAVAADAAALAGGTQLGKGAAAVTQAALDIAQKNGLALDQVIVEVDEDETGVSVRTTSAMKLFFGVLFNLEEGNMTQRARVARTRPVALYDVFPLGVDEKTELDYSRTVNLFGKELLGSGNWGALTFKDENGKYMTGANVFREFLKNGYSGVIEIGDLVMCKGGVNMGPISEGIDYRITEATKTHLCGLGNCPSGCPRILILPIYNETAIKDEVVIVDFAAFWVSFIKGSGAKTEVWGNFIRPHVRAAASVEGESRYGLTTIKLVK